MLLPDRAKEVLAESIVRLEAEQSRVKLTEVNRARLLYNNQTPPRLPHDMADDLKLEYRAEWAPASIAKACVDKLMSAMYGRIVDRKLGEDGKLPEAMTVQASDMLESWDRTAPRAYIHALIHGYCVIRFFPDIRSGVKFGIYDPDEATPIFDPMTEDLEPIGMVYAYKIPAENLPFFTKASQVNILEYFTVHARDANTNAVTAPGRRLRWWSDGGSWHPWPYFDGDEGLNPYGDHLGAVVWRNDDVTGPWGQSEITPIHDLLLSVSHTATDLKLLLKWNLWPPMASNSPGFADMPYSWRQVYELAPDNAGNKGEITRLDWQPQALTGGMEFLKLMLQLVNESTSVPAIAMGDLSDIGNLSSGRALEIVMMPLTDLTNRRQKLQAWQEEAALREMLAVWAHFQYDNGKGDILKVMDSTGANAYPFLYPYPVSVTFGPLQLARSTEDLIAYTTQIYAAGLASLDHCVRTLHPDWTEEQVIQELDRIQAQSSPREASVVDEGRTARIQAMIAGTGEAE